MRIKGLFFLLLAVLLTVLLASCARTGSSDSGRAKVRVSVWLGQAELDAMVRMAEEYNKDTPNVDIEYINILSTGRYGRERLLTMIAGNDAPDVMMLNTGQFEALAARNNLYNLDAFVQKESFDLSLYWPVAVEGCKFRGILYGLPKDISNVILFYNKDIFDAAGIPYPTSDWKFSDMLAAAEKMTIDKNGDGIIDQWGYALDNVVWAWAGHVWANDGEIFDANHTQVLLNNPRSIEALDDYFVKLNKFSPPPGALPDQSGSQDYMRSGITAMGLFGPWFRPTLVNMETPIRWDVAHYPAADRTGKHATVAYVDMWSVFHNSNVAEQAWNFMKYLSSKRAQEIWVELMGARSISPVTEVARSEGWITYGGSSGNIILEALAYARVPPINFSSGSEVETIWNQEFSSVVIGELTVQQAVANIMPQIQNVLNEAR